MPTSEVAHVLVVDDEPALRELLADALNAEDLKVTAAASAPEAIRLAAAHRPDLMIMDLNLGDRSGLEVIDEVRSRAGDVPALVITGYRDAAALAEASRRRPVELMTKPLDLPRLERTVREELGRRRHADRLQRRTIRLRRLARQLNRERRTARGKLESTCAELTCAYRTLNGQLSLHQAVIGFQNALIAARNDDDVFAALFRLFAARSGPVFGAALVCDESAQLNVIGRFGVPRPDELSFCRKLAQPVVELLLVTPRCQLIDAGDEAELFDPSIRRRLPGLTILAVPLLPAAGELIGVAVLYRKGEQPFSDTDLALADMTALPAATAVRRTD